LPAHTQAVTSLVFSRDGSLLVSGSQDRSVRLWGRSGASFVELFRLDKLPGPVRSVRLSDDKRRLAVLLEQERGVRIWKLDELNDRFAQLRARVDELPGE
jgi:WD40 repeat protein